MDRQSTNADTLQALAPVLAQALRQRGLGHLVLLGQIIRHWHTIAGPQLAAVTQPGCSKSPFTKHNYWKIFGASWAT
jgi:predicted nucleic acid-binding Zn ribbon protein